MAARRLIAATAIAASLLAGGPAFADALTDLLTSQGPGPATIGFSDYEAFGNLSGTGALQVGTTNYGTLFIRSITVNNNNVFSPTGPNGYLVGVFSGIQVTSITGGGLSTGNSGGVFSIYLVTTAQLAADGLTSTSLFQQGTGGYTGGCSADTQCYNGITNVGGTDVLNFALVPGADVVNPADTLQATLTATSFPPTGEAGGYGVITGGADSGVFGTGGFITSDLTLADLNITDEFCPNGSGVGQCRTTVGNWADESFDPVQADIVVPEPGSMALLGSALLSLGVFRFRRQRKSDPRR